LKLNIVDTPGYGDMINNDNCWDPIVKYVCPAGSRGPDGKLTNRSKTNTLLTFERSLLPFEIDISPIPVFIVVCSSSTLLDIP
jgi:hypothetical protein